MLHRADHLSTINFKKQVVQDMKLSVAFLAPKRVFYSWEKKGNSLDWNSRLKKIVTFFLFAIPVNINRQFHRFLCVLPCCSRFKVSVSTRSHFLVTGSTPITAGSSQHSEWPGQSSRLRYTELQRSKSKETEKKIEPKRPQDAVVVRDRPELQRLMRRGTAHARVLIYLATRKILLAESNLHVVGPACNWIYSF